MSWLVQPRLINGPFDDPGLFLDFRFGRRAMLFDLGDLGALSSRELLRVSHAFVSHTHMDHFAGFDRLLRLCLHRPGPLVLVGPGDFVARVAHRIRSYTWNLLDANSVDCRLDVYEFHDRALARGARLRARAGFVEEPLEIPVYPEGIVLAEESFIVAAAALDHGIPSLAFALREGLKVNVRRGALDELGLAPGAWLTDAKRAAAAGLADAHPVATPIGPLALGILRERAFLLTRGQRVAYVTDAADTPANRERITDLAGGADTLFIEAAFLDRDRGVAAATQHLTARAAGEIARAAGVVRVVPFHHSARYLGEPDALAAELHAAYAGGTVPSIVYGQD